VSESISISVDGKRFDTWSTAQIARAIDSIDTVQVSRPFDPTDPSQRETFKPLGYQSTVVSVGGETIVTGTTVPVVPELTDSSNMVALGIYSTPGVLSECPPDQASYPLEMKGLTLHEIAKRLCDPFGIRVKAVGVAPGKPFEKAKIGTGEILPSLAELAKAKGQLITSSKNGDLVFQAAKTDGSTVARLSWGLPPMMGIRPSIKPREYFSKVTGVKPIRPKSKKTEIFTVHTPHIGNVFRPFIYDVKDNLELDIQTNVQSKVSRMIGNVVSYDIEVATWRDKNGRLWEPNTFVEVYAPGVMIYRKFIFLIRSVVLTQNKDSETASLQVVLPGSFTASEKIGKYPWDE